MAQRGARACDEFPIARAKNLERQGVSQTRSVDRELHQIWRRQLPAFDRDDMKTRIAAEAGWRVHLKLKVDLSRAGARSLCGGMSPREADEDEQSQKAHVDRLRIPSVAVQSNSSNRINTVQLRRRRRKGLTAAPRLDYSIEPLCDDGGFNSAFVRVRNASRRRTCRRS